MYSFDLDNNSKRLSLKVTEVNLLATKVYPLKLHF